VSWVAGFTGFLEENEIMEASKVSAK